MRISGFSFARNADKLYYPVVESIRSILPICDEFIIAIGKGDDDDRTRELIAGIGDPRIRIIDTEWSDEGKIRSRIYSQQTNLALAGCTGDWCFYAQADEVVHEKHLPVIRRRCEELLDDRRIEGLLFDFRHFWGDYRHQHISHAWYPREVRIVRSGIGVASKGDAQSFRRNGEKLRVADAHADIFHYGWVRPPNLMNSKRREFAATYRGAQWVAEHYANIGAEFDYGSLERVPGFAGTHPAVMTERIALFSWGDKLQYHGRPRIIHKHDRFKYRALSFIERLFLGGRLLGGYRSYRLIRA
jgi:hypothetical protein